MRTLALLLFVIAGCGGSSPHPSPPQPASMAVVDDSKRDLLGEANRMLGAMRTTTYQHETIVDEATGRFDFDCSGFVGYALRRSQPDAHAALRRATVRRPLAKHFVAFFQSLDERGPWRRITRADELAPGDVIAWLKPAGVVTKNTGHVMIVRDAPHIDRTGVVIVPIIDSTGVPHGKGDSRKQRKRTGLGTGEVLLVVDDTGAPIAYRWSRGTKAKLHETTITLARLTPAATAQQ